LSWGIDKSKAEQESEALVFTRQMAALYRKESYSGKEQVLEMYYTDTNERCQIVMGKDKSRVVTDGFLSPTTKIETPLSVWRSIAAGEIRGDEALMKQLYKVKGDFNLMLKWDDYFGGPGGSTGAARKAGSGIHIPVRETNMGIMLIPWTVFWIFTGISNYIGSFASIGACVLVPLLFYQNKKTLYDVLSGALVGGLSMAVLLGAPLRMIMPLSYLTFGVMWIVTCFEKIPLTAHYSMNQYNGEDALLNPLFIKTNRILTWMWGILYLLTSVWTCFLMGAHMKTYIVAVNSIVPIFMGIFTVWFQKWYPARVARGR